MYNFNNFFLNKKVLITGHTGFKGTWLTQVMILSGATVAGFSLPKSHLIIHWLLPVLLPGPLRQDGR